MSHKVLITGTNSGFGRLAALALARRGHTVFATMRDVAGRNKAVAEEYRSLAEKENLKLHVVEMSLDQDTAVETGVQQALAKAEYFDAVVNNAGFASAGLVETMTSAQVQQQFEINVVGPHRVMRAVLPVMRKRGQGVVINVTSELGRITFPLMGVYCATKAALESMSDAYRYELKGVGVEVSMVQPGAFPTEIGNRMMMGQDQQRAEGYGPMAKGLDMLNASFAQMFSGANPPNPADVADAIVKIVEAPKGQRPQRVVVDRHIEPTVRLNDAHTEVQRMMLQGMGMGMLAD